MIRAACSVFRAFVFSGWSNAAFGLALLITAPLAAHAQTGAHPGAGGAANPARLAADKANKAKAVKGDKAFGEYLSSLCVTCHLPTGKAVGGIPPITGWPEDQFVAVLNAYRWKDRDNEVMVTVAAQLTDAEIASLATYFAVLPRP